MEKLKEALKSFYSIASQTTFHPEYFIRRHVEQSYSELNQDEIYEAMLRQTVSQPNIIYFDQEVHLIDYYMFDPIDFVIPSVLPNVPIEKIWNQYCKNGRIVTLNAEEIQDNGFYFTNRQFQKTGSRILFTEGLGSKESRFMAKQNLSDKEYQPLSTTTDGNVIVRITPAFIPSNSKILKQFVETLKSPKQFNADHWLYVLPISSAAMALESIELIRFQKKDYLPVNLKPLMEDNENVYYEIRNMNLYIHIYKSPNGWAMHLEMLPIGNLCTVSWMDIDIEMALKEIKKYFEKQFPDISIAMGPRVCIESIMLELKKHQIQLESIFRVPTRNTIELGSLFILYLRSNPLLINESIENIVNHWMTFMKNNPEEMKKTIQGFYQWIYSIKDSISSSGLIDSWVPLS